MNIENKETNQDERINIQITRTALARALNAGKISACDIHSLDINAKQSLWHLCLEACRTDCNR